MRTSAWVMAAVVIGVIGMLGVGATSQPVTAKGEVKTEGGLAIKSSALTDGGILPTEYSCDGESASPPLSWEKLPKGTRWVAVGMDHYPGPPRGGVVDRHVYFLIYNIPAEVTGIEKNTKGEGGVWGVNTVNGRKVYAPPCSKGPGPKKYVMHLWALSEKIPVAGGRGMTMEGFEEAIKGKVLGEAKLTVTYSRKLNGSTPPSPPPPQN